MSVRSAAASIRTLDGQQLAGTLTSRELGRAIRAEGLPLPAWLRPVNHDYISAVESTGCADLAGAGGTLKVGALPEVASASA